ncbi:carboxypeptidase M32 [Sphingosinicella rhizophila]|uniref:Metal-dependent carboxypeptidase n=1 Tax=Sphingosinicella rhizophila TaxID=3050082 RepID=A0ABU3QBR4_9SPHN|nr:carboxypeptidase M32 [Sphingosinicella sp. GR2756]MDT9600840.1 carboxypeptidase M32 [Sphingosinicella sp. GR2756]
MNRANDNRAYRELHERFETAGKLGAARNTLFWDSQTYMPPGAAWSRGEQLAAIDTTCSQLTAGPDTADLFCTADDAAELLSPTERSNLNEMRRMWRHNAAVPKLLLQEKARQVALLQGIWVQAKQANDFHAFASGFELLMPLTREIAQAKADALGLAPYDALMDEFDPGLSMALIDPIFAELECFLPALLVQVIERQSTWPAEIPYSGDFSAERQRALSYRLAEAVGHDLKHVRIDAAPHPFALAGSPGDNRFTTRFDAGNIGFAVMATLHEAGHALYEANLPRAQAFTPVGNARGATAHESQSLMVEKQAGRSREFLGWLASQMAEAFGGDPACWTFANVVRTNRRVGVGYIRVEADEISYPLHVILRYRIERALLDGDLKIADLPDAWSDLSQSLFGRRPPDHAHGCLQDIHWAMGLFGYFPNYALGSSLAAQLFERAVQDDAAVIDRLSDGDFGPYRAWVVPRIHERASQVSFAQLVEDATGAPLSVAALKRHLQRRYLEEDVP